MTGKQTAFLLESTGPALLATVVLAWLIIAGKQGGYGNLPEVLSLSIVGPLSTFGSVTLAEFLRRVACRLVDHRHVEETLFNGLLVVGMPYILSALWLSMGDQSTSNPLELMGMSILLTMPSAFVGLVWYYLSASRTTSS